MMIHNYISDLFSWGSIVARTTEFQINSALAYSFSFPLGFKNRTDGSVSVSINSVISSSKKYCLLSINNEGKLVIIKTNGNINCHIILRGGKT